MRSFEKGLVDTNLLVFASDKNSPWFEKSTKFLEVLMGNLGLILAPQVLLELYNALVAGGVGSGEAIRAINYYRDLSGVSLIYPLEGTYYRALLLAKRHKIGGKSKIFDAHLAATAIDHKIKVIYTQNVRDFSMFGGVKAVNPLR